MAAPQTPQPGRQPGSAGPRRPRAWLARRMAAVLSAVAVFGLGGLMYWNDHQSGTAQAATSVNSSNPTSSSTSSDNRVSGSGDDGESEHESDNNNGSIVDDITRLIPGLSDNSSSSSSSSSGTSSSGTSSSGTSAPAPSPHSSTRGS